MEGFGEVNDMILTCHLSENKNTLLMLVVVFNDILIYCCGFLLIKVFSLEKLFFIKKILKILSTIHTDYGY